MCLPDYQLTGEEGSRLPEYDRSNRCQQKETSKII